MENIRNLSVYLLVIRSEGLLLVNEILDVIINGMMAMCPKKRLNAKEFGVDNTCWIRLSIWYEFVQEISSF